MANFIFEIGTEEIPPNMIPLLLDELKGKVEEKLRGKRIYFSSIKIFGTPRRLGLFIEEIALRQEDTKETIYGPPLKIAKKEDGTFSDAAIGFAKKAGFDLDELKILKGPKGEVIGGIKEVKGRETSEILKEELPQIVDSLYLPKSMRWGEGDYLFVRPLRWVLALLEDKVVEIVIKGVKSSNRSRGKRFFGKEEIALSHADGYFDLLKEEFVISDIDERSEKIRKELNFHCKKIDGFYDDESEGTRNLFETVLFLSEYPTVLLGEISEEFVSLPAPVLSTCLREHQKFFSVYKKDGNENIKPLPYFLAVLDGPESLRETALRGLQNVTIARLSDARFFFEHDKKVKLEQRLEELKGIVFHPKIGTYYEKSRRMERYARELAPFFNVDKDLSARCALLAKSDLASLLVQEKEFTSLQGIAGGLYAEAQGEDYRVAKGIKEHYNPPIEKDAPTNPLSLITALADKLDTLMEFFKIKEIPSGSKDPFGLRRAGKIVADILSNPEYYKDGDRPEVNLMEILTKWYGRECPELIDFLKERLRFIFESEKDEEGNKKFNYDEINALLSTPFSNLLDIREKLTALNLVRKSYSDDFDAISIAFKRAKNILKGMPHYRLDPALFMPEGTKEGDSEKALHRAYIQIKDSFEEAVKNRNYIDALTTLATLRPFIDRFFDDVLVMCDPEGKDPKKSAIQQNRLALLQRITKLFFVIADFSEIVPKGEN
jgi:glycyl-tRNA synthetase beta chain